MNAKPGVQNTTSQKITISIVVMLAPASWSIREVCGFPECCQAKLFVRRNLSGICTSPKSIHYLSREAIEAAFGRLLLLCGLCTRFNLKVNRPKPG
jgi:hypothetical protein